MNIFDNEKKLEETMIGLTETIENAVDDFFKDQNGVHVVKELLSEKPNKQGKHTLEELMQVALEYLYRKFLNNNQLSSEDCNILLNVITHYEFNKKD